VSGWAGVENRIDAAIQVFQHVGGGGGAGVAKGVGAGCGQRNASAANQLNRYTMGRHAHPDQRAPGSDGIGNGAAARKQQGERSRPKGGHQLARGLRDLGNQIFEHGSTLLAICYMHDDRVPGRTLLSLKNSLHRGRVQRIRPKSVHRLRGQRHKPTGAQYSRRLAERFLRVRRLKMIGIHDQSKGLHALIVALRSRMRPPAVYSLEPMPVETEVKFRLDDPAGLSERLEAAGFHVKTPRSFESNVLYDTPDRRMRARTEILRLRSYAGRWTLTHKRLPDGGPGLDTHKHRIETETEVSDGKALAEVFLSLGLVPAFRYEKWRTEWEDGEGHCVVDETPIGDFAELEGPGEWIDRSAARLGIERGQYITLSYGRLFEQWREQQGSSALDLTFAAVAERSLRK
jgi:adenylate cyclase class 2